MVNDKYWENRERDWINSNIRKDIDFDKAIASKYDELELNMYKEVQSFYVNYAKAANITYAEAEKRVSQFDVNDFSKEAAKLVKSKDFSPEANERLKLYNATMRINRQTMLASKLGLEAAKVSSNMEGMTRDKLEKDIYDEAKHQAGILGKTVPERMDLRVKTLVDADYQGAKWSERLWSHNDALVADIGNIVSQSLIQGMNPTQLASKLRPHLKDSISNAKYAAQRLARTESTRVATEYKQNLYKDEGFTKGEWLAEPTACSKCLPNDGKIFNLDEINIPKHANCRCSFVPSIESASIQSKDTADQIDTNDFDISSIRGINRYFDNKQISEMNELFEKAPTNYRRLYKEAFNKISIGGESTREASYFSPSEEKIYFKKGTNTRTFFHEYAHGIDHIGGYNSVNVKVKDAINDAFNSYIEPFKNKAYSVK